MRTRITPVEELQKILTETLLNKTNKVSKISDDSSLFAYTFGGAKIGQKAIKDIALIEAHLFPDFAHGIQLDNIANDHGVAERFLSSKSSTYVRLVGDPGTQYLAGVHRITGNSGLFFDLEENFTVGSLGFGYAKVKSVETGNKTNVDPLELNRVDPEPAGHKYVINEFKATGGRDVEQDEFFRRRIKNAPNINAQRTLSFLEQLFLTVNPNVLRVFHYGFNSNGKVELGIATQNAVNFTQNELDELLEEVGDRLSLIDLKDFTNQLYGIKLRNVEYTPIDIDFRVLLNQSFDPDLLRIQMQTQLQSKLDYRFYKEGQQVQWDDFFNIIKSVKGVEFLPNKHFKINGGLSNIDISRIKLPRLRSFIMRDVEGNIITNKSGTFVPAFYPARKDTVFASTVIE